MVRARIEWLRRAKNEEMFRFYQNRALSWFRQDQYCLGADYILRSLNHRPKDAVNLVLGKAAGLVLQEPELVKKCDESLARLMRIKSTDQLSGILKPSDSRTTHVLEVLEKAVQLSKETVSSTRIETLAVLERLSAQKVQDMVDERVIRLHGGSLPLKHSSERWICVTEPKDSKYGRGLYANQRIKRGTVLLVDDMLFAQRVSDEYCAHCLQRLQQTKRAPSSSSSACEGGDENYCSDSCKDAAWKQYHQCCCSTVNPDFYQWSMHMWNQVKSRDQDAASEAKAAIRCLAAAKLFCMCTVSQMHPMDLSGLSHLRGVVEFESRTGLSQVGAMAVALGDALRQPNLHVEEVLSMLAIVQTNEFELPEGHVVYPVLSLLNHSCTPNCVVAGPTPRTQQLVAVNDIRPGEQLFIDYNPRLTGSLDYEQRRELFAQRNFECFCSKCITRQ